jgi:hypothetical protein
MNLFTPSVLILSSIMTLGIMFTGGHSQAVERANLILPEPELPVMIASGASIQVEDP